MHGPVMSGWLLVALSTATGVYCLARMRSDSMTARTAAGGEAMMGFGMASMALPAAVLTAPAWGWSLVAVAFGCGALRALWLARTGAHHLHHLVGTLAMVHMAATMAAAGPPGGHMGHPAAGAPLVTGVLLAYYAAYVLRTGAALMPVPTAAASAAGPPGPVAGSGRPGWGARPELALACRLSMGIAMFAMLLTL